MYRCQNCGEKFDQFKVLGQCPFCNHLSKMQCSCGHRAEGWEFVKNNDKCPKCNRPVQVEGGMSEYNQPKEPKKRPKALWIGAAAAVVLIVAIVAWALLR